MSTHGAPAGSAPMETSFRGPQSVLTMLKDVGKYREMTITQIPVRAQFTVKALVRELGSLESRLEADSPSTRGYMPSSLLEGTVCSARERWGVQKCHQRPASLMRALKDSQARRIHAGQVLDVQHDFDHAGVDGVLQAIVKPRRIRHIQLTGHRHHGNAI